MLKRIIKWLCGEKEVLCSMDYFNQLSTQLQLHEERIKKLELKSQLKPSGEFKVFGPTPDQPKRKKKKYLTPDEISQMKADRQAGWKVSEIAGKYGVEKSTVYRLTMEKENA